MIRLAWLSSKQTSSLAALRLKNNLPNLFPPKTGALIRVNRSPIPYMCTSLSPIYRALSLVVILAAAPSLPQPALSRATSSRRALVFTVISSCMR